MNQQHFAHTTVRFRTKGSSIKKPVRVTSTFPRITPLSKPGWGNIGVTTALNTEFGRDKKTVLDTQLRTNDAQKRETDHRIANRHRAAAIRESSDNQCRCGARRTDQGGGPLGHHSTYTPKIQPNSARP